MGTSSFVIDIVGWSIFSGKNTHHVFDVLDEAAKRGSVSHDQNSFSGGNIRSDRLEPEGHRSLDEVLEGLVEWEVRLRDGGEQLAVGWQLKKA